ncbi:hypothetical protein A7A78_08330 [Aequorivita soesokkakensis]|uniref:Uncharacterized protein n=1 Tax=Aequorivita soesokkakensis TaxID=1385699 RepID=A0A1A9LB78_9FLAO|nr:hypothetical protein [Aequorivita soesokkakensis]OAD89991.1 hypothetical protein A7A78_08330 [Aequorivita soesokkakensis]
MISTITKLQIAIGRSQAAYNLYVPEKKYFQALRIKSANLNVYEILEVYLYECEENEKKAIQQYIFHLEDWFNQFEELERTGPELESEFVFERLKNSPEFPKTFVNKILLKKL